MDLEPSIHSFVIKIWLEESTKESGRAVWRGHITHVASGNRKYVKGMDEIATFIRIFLRETDQQPGWRHQLAARLKRWGRHF